MQQPLASLYRSLTVPYYVQINPSTPDFCEILRQKSKRSLKFKYVEWMSCLQNVKEIKPVSTGLAGGFVTIFFFY